MFSVVRGYNILIIVIAQYLASIYILAHDRALGDVLLDLNLFFLVLASAATIAGGYIINNFYDSEKDLINRPNKTMLDSLVSQNTKLSFYFVLNFLALLWLVMCLLELLYFFHFIFLVFGFIHIN